MNFGAVVLHCGAWKGQNPYTECLFKEVPLLAILTRDISSNFPLSSCQYVSTIPEKNCMLPTSLKNRHFVGVCTEKMINHQYREHGSRNTYSSYNQMTVFVKCSLDQSKKLSIEQSWGFRNSAGGFCISVLPEYCNSALIAQAYKMVITTLCVQIGNCFCNTWIVVHLCASLRWFRGTLLLAIYNVFSLTWTQSGNFIIELSCTLNLICKVKQLIWLPRTIV